MAKTRDHVPMRIPAMGRTVMSEVVGPPELVCPDKSKYEPEFLPLDFWEIAPIRTKSVVDMPDTDREPLLLQDRSKSLEQELTWLLWFCCQDTATKEHHAQTARELGRALLKQRDYTDSSPPVLPYRCGTMLMTAGDENAAKIFEAWTERAILWCCWYGAYGDFSCMGQAALAWDNAINNLGPQGHHYRTVQTTERQTMFSVVENQGEADEFNDVVRQVISRLAKTNPRPRSRKVLGFHPGTVPWHAITREQFEVRCSEPNGVNQPRSNEQQRLTKI